MRALILLLLLSTVPAQAQRLTVVELFTSQGCSSCPPADALLAELAAADAKLLPLSLHVTYWDRGGWVDPFSLAAATERQQDTKRRLDLDYIYTPQLVVDGWQQAIGSDRAAVRQALAAAAKAPGVPVSLTIEPKANGLRIGAGSGSGRGTLILVGFDRAHATAVAAGENAGRTVSGVNIVRSMRSLGPWTGAPVDVVSARPLGERSAVLLQAENGHILGAVATP